MTGAKANKASIGMKSFMCRILTFTGNRLDDASPLAGVSPDTREMVRRLLARLHLRRRFVDNSCHGCCRPLRGGACMSK